MVTILAHQPVVVRKSIYSVILIRHIGYQIQIIASPYVFPFSVKLNIGLAEFDPGIEIVRPESFCVDYAVAFTEILGADPENTVFVNRTPYV